ncbi:MAG: efflux RND transporter periplasmic adaptor subunit [Candidatus Aminicenantes bacterium]|nr:MAG: efflux RND transporter periplasmic adaptor subunit [Candidatus Aminicenantes bacterium]
MNKKTFIIPVLITLIIAACGPPQDNRARLARLEAQREALDVQIEQLKAEIAGETDATPKQALAYVRGIELQPSLFQHYIQVQGTVESDNNILIPAQSNGVVKKIHVRQGEHVSRGQLLAELDGAILERGIDELTHSLELVTTIYERQERLWNKNIGSEIEYLQAKNNKENLEKKLETLQEQYKLTKIHAPISGSVDDVMIKEGEMAAAGYGTIRIVQLTRLKITASLSENYISRVSKNHPVKVLIPVIGRELELKINAVSQVIDPNNRTFKIEIKIPAREKDIKPNMLSVVTINDYTNAEALTVPYNVVQDTGIGYFLFVAEKQNDQWIAKRRTVTLGENYADRVEIREGLSAGEFVITFGFQALADGQTVSLQQD